MCVFVCWTFGHVLYKHVTLLMLVGHSRSNWTLWCLLNDLHSFNSLTPNQPIGTELFVYFSRLIHLHTLVSCCETHSVTHYKCVWVCGRAFLKMNGMREREAESVSVYVCLLVVVVNEMYLFHLIFFWIAFLKFSLCFLLYHMFVISFVHGTCPFCTYSDTNTATHTLTHIYLTTLGGYKLDFFVSFIIDL